ncbi:hypothetical protein SH668x_000134 [Planctomicrobium sp. SH668]
MDSSAVPLPSSHLQETEMTNGKSHGPAKPPKSETKKETKSGKK